MGTASSPELHDFLVVWKIGRSSFCDSELSGLPLFTITASTSPPAAETGREGQRRQGEQRGVQQLSAGVHAQNAITRRE